MDLFHNGTKDKKGVNCMENTYSNVPLFYKNEIIHTLLKFQEGYTKRDLTILEDFMNELFNQSKDVTIVGTSSSEWCLGIKEVKQIIKNDWEHWGDVNIDINNALIYSVNNVAWLTVPANVTFNFENSENAHQQILNYIHNYFNREDKLYNISAKAKLTSMNLIISHILSYRKEGIRKYRYPISIFAVLTKQTEKWIFQHMNFSVSNNAIFPDVRIDNQDIYDNIHEVIRDKLSKHIDGNKNKYTNIRNRVYQLQEDIFNNKSEVFDIRYDRIFARNLQVLVVDTENSYHRGKIEIIKYFKHCINMWDNISIDINNAIVNSDGQVAWVTTYGLITSVIDEQTALEKQINNINSIMHETACDSTQKLFKIRRDIAFTLEEISRGEQYTWLCRLSAILINQEGDWNFSYIQLSLPSEWILEGKMDVPLING